MTSPGDRLVPRTPAGEAGLHCLLERPGEALLAFDFDGVLSPIVDDPDAAYAHPAVVPLLSRLAARFRAVAIVTGRPAEVVVRLGGFADAPDLGGLLVVGHYGAERWDATTGEITAPPVPAGVAEVRDALPGLLREWGAPEGTAIEDKGRAVAVHVRRTSDPAAATDLLTGRLTELAQAHGLTVQPGRMVLELKPPGMDKGVALRALVAEVGASCVAYSGDDLGDLPAYDAVEELRGEGIAGLLVCSGSTEVTALAGRADVVVDGPPGVVSYFNALAARLG
ncbi:trehalose-phosphatase [Actinopolymorpha sp. B17G11]|uniref:trehalose-phosphatase n=1 Tax=Actinopolymorpha sp. B17G11 TaxID=3160861 RepID=UPI0032E49C80